MGYCLNRLDEPVFMAVPKPMLTEFGIHHGLERWAELPEYSIYQGPGVHEEHEAEP